MTPSITRSHPGPHAGQAVARTDGPLVDTAELAGVVAERAPQSALARHVAVSSTKPSSCRSAMSR